MKKKITIVLVLALGLASGSYAEEGIWTTKSPMPTARYVLSSSVVDGKIYAIGGTPDRRKTTRIDTFLPAKAAVQQTLLVTLPALICLWAGQSRL